jgi:hypothetical protein
MLWPNMAILCTRQNVQTFADAGLRGCYFRLPEKEAFGAGWSLGGRRVCFI